MLIVGKSAQVVAAAPPAAPMAPAAEQALIRRMPTATGARAAAPATIAASICASIHRRRSCPYLHRHHLRHRCLMRAQHAGTSVMETAFAPLTVAVVRAAKPRSGMIPQSAAMAQWAAPVNTVARHLSSTHLRCHPGLERSASRTPAMAELRVVRSPMVDIQRSRSPS